MLVWFWSFLFTLVSLWSVQDIEADLACPLTLREFRVLLLKLLLQLLLLLILILLILLVLFTLLIVLLKKFVLELLILEFLYSISSWQHSEFSLETLITTNCSLLVFKWSLYDGELTEVEIIFLSTELSYFSISWVR